MADRRSNDRFRLNEGAASIEFGYPTPQHETVSLSVRDISKAGLSFQVSCDLPGFGVGKVLDDARLRIQGRTIRGDLVVMHLTAHDPPDRVCGAIFCPAEDEDILHLRAVISDLDAAADVAAESA